MNILQTPIHGSRKMDAAYRIDSFHSKDTDVGCHMVLLFLIVAFLY